MPEGDRDPAWHEQMAETALIRARNATSHSESTRYMNEHRRHKQAARSLRMSTRSDDLQKPTSSHAVLTQHGFRKVGEGAYEKPGVQGHIKLIGGGIPGGRSMWYHHPEKPGEQPRGSIGKMFGRGPQALSEYLTRADDQQNLESTYPKGKATLSGESQHARLDAQRLDAITSAVDDLERRLDAYEPGEKLGRTAGGMGIRGLAVSYEKRQREERERGREDAAV